MNIIERYRGCMYGTACGDAVGTTVEFSPPGTFEPVTDMTGGGPFELNRGEWTDDFSRSLCNAESLVVCRGFNAKDQMERLLRWRDEGHLSSNGRCFDIGNTVAAALKKFQATGNPYAGGTDNWSNGNGSLMGLAPIVLAYAHNPKAAIEAAALFSRTTHGGVMAVDACRYYAALLIGALNGAKKEELLSPMYSPVPGYWEEHPLCPEIEAIARGSYKEVGPPVIQGSGYVVASLEAALWSFHRSTTFEAGCLLAANLGDDADTTAAIFGQLAGAFYGESGVPQRWREWVAKRKWVEDFSDKLLELSQSKPAPAAE
jgi:ADP-ribosylglycohydrolase